MRRPHLKLAGPIFIGMFALWATGCADSGVVDRSLAGPSSVFESISMQPVLIGGTSSGGITVSRASFPSEVTAAAAFERPGEPAFRIDSIVGMEFRENPHIRIPVPIVQTPSLASLLNDITPAVGGSGSRHVTSAAPELSSMAAGIIAGAALLLLRRRGSAIR